MSYTLITVARCTCDRPQCGRSFTARDDQPPARCPYCGSKKWDVHGLRSAVDSGTHKQKGEAATAPAGKAGRVGASGPLQPESAGGRTGPSSSGRKPDFHSGNAGSIPAGPTKESKKDLRVVPLDEL